MKLYTIPSCSYLAKQLSVEQGNATIKQFSDGEWSVTIHDTVACSNVWVLAQTGPPADNLVQLILLLNALQHAGAKINIVITYFGYARQDKPVKGEADAAKLMAQLIEQSNPQRIEVIHLHNPTIFSPTNELSYWRRIFPWRAVTPTNHIPYEFFYQCSQDIEAIVAPDKGARYFAQHIAQERHKELILLTKTRPAPEQVTLHLQGSVAGKRVLIVDDMITTGNTVIQTAELLYAGGATSVSVAATHGVFSDDARERLTASPIVRISVTNTLPQDPSTEKIQVVDCAPFIRSLMT